MWKCWSLRRGENRSTWRKTSQRKEENQQQPQLTYGIDTRNLDHIGGRQALSPVRHPLLSIRVGAKSHIPSRNLVFFQIQLHNFRINNIVSNIFNQLICEFQVANIKCKCIQLFWERLSEKGHMTIPKGIEGSLESTVLQRNLKESHWRPWTYVWSSTNGKQQKEVRQLLSLGTVYWSYPILPFGLSCVHFFPTAFLKIAVCH